MKLNRKDLLNLESLSSEEIELILNTAVPFKRLFTHSIKKVPTLRGKTVAFLFYEPSTRTRTSFELAAKRLAADTLDLAVPLSSVQKGESLLDTGKTLEAMKVDFIVIRHSENGAPELLSKNLKVHVVNAGDGTHEHPTQGLLDLFTLREKKKKIKGLRVVILGDILHSRVARSNLWGLTKMGARVTLCGPKSLLPEEIKRVFGKSVRIEYDLKKAVEDADAINVLRIQKERQSQGFIPSLTEYIERYGLHQNKISWLKKDCIVLHPGPMNRGIEIDSSVADGERSVILEQVTNGIAIRMAVLYLLAGSTLNPQAALENS
ncbi:MAG: aspartate carbamoyltransferase [Elusimicrobia bacterium RIFCSPLOWO2_02_FULL_39_32]|nr:MAG: aspartate carbamoyltransferase [Elusimicrobia bacterium RIFCSPHIGHO2_02_FULL_39_36]OGR91487.1 MAG: aspartate carbamoyltransferase [Elusimicrobia bacterium RIFCSPLOWO2_02_FULL_39_32]OGS00742.1 MAG: aspartate carbamoyltransferase [Elusimicrobia bacterium RIFCSPLOWO2_12_FULL_39_28]